MGNDLYLEVRHSELQPNLLTKYKSVEILATSFEMHEKNKMD